LRATPAHRAAVLAPSAALAGRHFDACTIPGSASSETNVLWPKVVRPYLWLVGLRVNVTSAACRAFGTQRRQVVPMIIVITARRVERG
jgi:hypothetical protein